MQGGGGGLGFNPPPPLVRKPPLFFLFFFTCHPGGRSGRRTVPLPNGVARLSTLRALRKKKCRSTPPPPPVFIWTCATFEAGKNHPLYKFLRTLVVRPYRQTTGNGPFQWRRTCSLLWSIGPFQWRSSCCGQLEVASPRRPT